MDCCVGGATCVAGGSVMVGVSWSGGVLVELGEHGPLQVVGVVEVVEVKVGEVGEVEPCFPWLTLSR